jgi:hypothetical protein
MRVKLVFVTQRGQRVITVAVVGKATVANVAALGMLSLGLGKLPQAAKFSALSASCEKLGSLVGSLPLLPSLRKAGKAGFISTCGCVLVALPMRRTRGG